jgi:hypothetical protein
MLQLLWDLRFSRRWMWRLPYSEMRCRVTFENVADVSEEVSSSISWCKKQASNKQSWGLLLLPLLGLLLNPDYGENTFLRKSAKLVYRTTRRYISEVSSTLRYHRHESLRSPLLRSSPSSVFSCKCRVRWRHFLRTLPFDGIESAQLVTPLSEAILMLRWSSSFWTIQPTFQVSVILFLPYHCACPDFCACVFPES